MIKQTQSHEPQKAVKREIVERRVFVALPAFNEASCLGNLLEKIGLAFVDNGYSFGVIVVDDGSTDATAEIAAMAAKELPVDLVRHQKNRGLSGAINTGLRRAIQMGKENDIIITMDADDTHPPKTIDLLITAIDEGCDVVIASRYQPGSRVVGVPWVRLLMTQVASYLFRWLMPINGVRDYTCGYRAYKHSVLKQSLDYYGDQFVSEQGFSCMVDILLKLRRFHFVMGEVPFVLRYDQKQGVSKMPVYSTIWKTLSLFVKRRFGGY